MTAAARGPRPVPAADRAWAGLLRSGLLTVVLLAFVVYRLSAMAGHAAPPGSDGGNWLAFGRELLGEDVKAARSAYPPIVPALDWALSRLIGPLGAAKILGATSAVLAGIPLYLVAASAAPWWAALLGTVAFVGAGYRSEVVAFGGYPQLVGEAFTLGALWLYARGVGTGRRRTLIGGAVLAALAVGSHHLSSVILVTATAVLTAMLLLQALPAKRIIARLVGFGLLTILLSVPFLPAYASMVRELAGSPMNAQGWSLATAGDTFGYLFRNAVGLWYALLGVAGMGVLLPAPAERRTVRTLAAASLLTPLGLFAYFAEVRFLQFLFVGMALGLALAAAFLWEAAAQPRARQAVAAATLAVVAVVVWAGTVFTRQAFPWYQVIDNDRLEALEWLKQKSLPDSVILATATRNGWPIGWWIEGYTGRKTIIGADLRWMAFRQEQAHAQEVSAVVDLLRANDPAAVPRIKRLGVGYLFLDEENWPGGPPDVPFLEPAFENPAVIILRVGDRAYAADGMDRR